MLPLLFSSRLCMGKACECHESGVWGVSRSSRSEAAGRGKNLEFPSLPPTLRPISGGQVGEKDTKTQPTQPVEVRGRQGAEERNF
jgi:hypothetical protein